MSKSVFPVAAALVIALVLITLGTSQPLPAIRAFFLAPFTNSYYLSNMISLASMLLLSGTGIAIAFSAGSFNLGGEGQSYAGGLAPAIIILLLGQSNFSFPMILLIGLLAVAAAILASGTQGFISGYLGSKLNIDPLISSFLLSSALVPVMDGLIIGPLRDQQSNLLTMPRLPEVFELPAISAIPRFHLGIIIAILIWLSVLLWYRNSRLGYEMKLVGSNRDFAGFSGLQVGKLLTLAMIISAALHGSAGFLTLFAVQHAAVLGFTSGLGWNGIAVSLISGNRISRMPIGALVFAYLINASNAAMVYTSFSFELSSVIQASVFLLVSVDFVISRSKNKGGKQ